MLFIFDLDGTLTPQRPASDAPFEKTLLPGVDQKCEELRQANHILAIASNQGAVARGWPVIYFDNHCRWLGDELGISRWLYATGERKKPNPAMLLELIHYFRLPAMFVGDAETDRQAANNAGIEFAWSKDFFNQF